MCQSPIRIRNPNKGMKGSFYDLKDTVSAFINVPCGHCDECIANKQMQMVQRIQMEEMDNYIFFSTLTYNNESMPYLTCSNGHSIRFADVADVQRMMKRLRKSGVIGRDFRFFAVSELGSSKGRPHFHILWFIPKCDGDDKLFPFQMESVLKKEVLHEWRRNYGSTRNPVYKPLCTYVRKMIRGEIRTNYDLHYVNPVLSDGGTADVAFYVLKYMMKPSDRAKRLQQALRLNLDELEYEDVWKVVRPRHFYSKHFGLAGTGKREQWIPSAKIVSKLKHDVQLSKKNSDYPCYFNPVNGKSFPLSRYYRSKGDIYRPVDAYDFYYNSKKQDLDNVVIDDRDINQDLTALDRLADNVRHVDLKQDTNELDELYL